MKNIVTLLILGCIASCASIKPESSPMQMPTTSKSLLWKISGNGITSDCYVFGTMHLIEKQYFYFPKSVQNKVGSAKRIILEIADLNQAEAMKYLMLPEGETMLDYFTQLQKDTLFSYMKENMLMDSVAIKTNLNKFKPFILTQLLAAQAFNGKTEQYEKWIEDIAKKKSIKKYSLETIGDQMSLFDGLSKKEQADMAMQGMTKSQESNTQLIEMMKIYRRQNVDSLYLLVKNDGGSVSKNEDKFLANRNMNWIPKLKVHFASNENCFVGVGAAHLGGPTGILRLLQKEGYTITPIKM